MCGISNNFSMFVPLLPTVRHECRQLYSGSVLFGGPEALCLCMRTTWCRNQPDKGTRGSGLSLSCSLSLHWCTLKMATIRVGRLCSEIANKGRRSRGKNIRLWLVFVANTYFAATTTLNLLTTDLDKCISLSGLGVCATQEVRR